MGFAKLRMADVAQITKRLREEFPRETDSFLASRHAAVPMQAEDPVGAERLRALIGHALPAAAE